jgi:hypothetical protein
MLQGESEGSTADPSPAGSTNCICSLITTDTLSPPSDNRVILPASGRGGNSAASSFSGQPERACSP